MKRLSPRPKDDIVTDNEASTAFDARRRLLLAVEEHLAIKALGFAGVLATGTMVDRREHPDAIPLQRNATLDIPEPIRCYRAACRSYRLAWLDKAAGEIECLECGKLQRTIG